MVRQSARLVISSGLSAASKAETVVYALEHLGRVYPEFEEVLVADARRYLQSEAVVNSGEIGRVELSWSLVADFVAAGHAYAQLKEAQVAAGWLPVAVDLNQLDQGALSLSSLEPLSSQALDVCIQERVLETLVERPADGWDGSGFVHETWSERVWSCTLDDAVEYAAHAYTSVLSGRQANSIARAYVVPWVLAKVLYHHLGVRPRGPEWVRIAAHFDAHPEERIRLPSADTAIPGEVVPVSDELLRSAGDGVLA
ncbi:hypothetical protein POJ06DRAFT_258625 [Lipomyces tetrasporus]|uniref:Uncharacterized protein n=1 Tax=Lipomyces tetrasporus TaxID=54092 RepID=A0AAD7VPS6_9ASCO|nr:uncharacterized protein POJ06DRAFT_258625 [Lipomyces tetrasporus]KAJ8098137.1 hypothetical protein POJ06DRAFT_258625 [Lipomyces tetrasporus]